VGQTAAVVLVRELGIEVRRVQVEGEPGKCVDVALVDRASQTLVPLAHLVVGEQSIYYLQGHRFSFV
jgi:hypothetical protein